MCEGRESFLLALKAVCSRQDPTGVNQDSSTSVKVFLETGLENVNDRLPRLLRDVALSAPKHAERRVIQGVVQPLATCCYRQDMMVKLLVMVTIHQTHQRKWKL